MKVTKNRLDLMVTEQVVIDGVSYDVKDPLSVQFRDFVMLREASEHRVQQFEVSRPDVVSFAEYGTAGYWWFVAAVAGVVDPYEMPEQELVKIPTTLDYFDWFRAQKAALGG